MSAVPAADPLVWRVRLPGDFRRGRSLGASVDDRAAFGVTSRFTDRR